MSARSSLQLYKKPIADQICCTRTSFPRVPRCVRSYPQRSITTDEKPLPKAENGGPGPNQEQLPHVSEEAAATSKVTGESGPELEQGTPVQEVLQRDEKAQQKAPKVMQNDAKQSSPHGSRSYSTSARRQAQTLLAPNSTSMPIQGEGQGHIFPLPELPLPSKSHIKRRYEPIVDQVTKLMMKHGELSKAQKTMSMILERLRTAAPPSNPQRPLYPGSPPPAHLPLNPIAYLTTAIDSVAPLLRIRSQKGAAGGGMALQIPVPLNLRQRRRTAIEWILDAASKKQNRAMYPNKVADELIAVVEGKSSVWEKRQGIHKLSVNARANLGIRYRKNKSF